MHLKIAEKILAHKGLAAVNPRLVANAKKVVEAAKKAAAEIKEEIKEAAAEIKEEIKEAAAEIKEAALS